MNDENKTPGPEALLEREWEARLVARVLGEASAFEAAELERLVLEKPELGVFKRRIEAVHGLVSAATRLDQAPLRLAPERRAKILETIGASSAPQRAEPSPTFPLLVSINAAKRKRRKTWIWASGLAASVMFATALTVQMTRRNYYSSETKAALNSVDVAQAETSELALPRADQSPPPAPADKVVTLSPFTIAPRPSLMSRVRGAFAPASRPSEEVQSGGSIADSARQESRAKRDERDLWVKEKLSAVAKKREAESSNDHANLKNLTFGVSAPKPALVPFEIGASADGYVASNTLAGTRLNTQIGDLASSISVVTKQQLADTAGLDVNDVFLSDRNLEGAAGRKDVAALSATDLDQRLSQEKAAAKPAAPPAPKETVGGEVSTAREPVSTFSLHVSDVSFRLAQAALARGETPDASRIRPEEFYNAFDYGDPAPTQSDKVSARIEQSAHPLLQQRNLVRIAMKVASSGRGAGQPLHLTLLLDTSGSMEREDRVASVQRALTTLASLLGAKDRVTLIGFSREPRLIVDQLPGDQAGKLPELASHIPFTGGTNLEQALKLAGELARRHQDPTAQNRIVLLTDGAANLGNADPVQLTAQVEALRQQKIALDACGVGTEGLDDTVLEALTRKGDGRYYVLNQSEDADGSFARQLAGAFRPAAENVKLQVRFNPARVASYRLIGFEQHRLREEDFRNDQVDAAELAADEAAVALYQIEVLPQGEGELGDVFVRFRDAASGNMVERSWTMLHEPRARPFDRATPSLQLAGTAALLADKLHGGDAADLVDLDEIAPTVATLRGYYAGNARVQELIAMFDQTRRAARP